MNKIHVPALGLVTASALAMMSVAQAQNASPGIEEVEITATRQTSTVNKVAMAVSAVSQKSLEEQGIKNVEDLARQVPGVLFRKSGGEGNPNITIRGIGGNSATVGSPTTGIYLDDSALQRRNVNGLITGNGSPFPQLFDLERVEVLRGPQGTLYGGSSQGGTIRFITPKPSLTAFSGQSRAEYSTTQGGGSSGELGAAYGGPLVDNVLGLRLAGFVSQTGGWVDAKSQYDGHTFAKDINKSESRSIRGTMLWQVNDLIALTPAVFLSRESTKDKADFRMATDAYTITGGTFNNSGTVNGVKFSFPNRTFAGFAVPAQTWYGKNVTANGRYLSTTDVKYQPSPRTTDLFLPNLTADFDFNRFTVKSITTYVDDKTTGMNFTGGGIVRTGILPNATQGAINAPYLPGFPDRYSYYYYENIRNTFSEEIRIASKPEGQRLNYVGGVFVSDSKIHVHGAEHSNENAASLFLRGVPEAWFLGAYPLPMFRNPATPNYNDFGDVSDREVFLTEKEFAVFGELTFAITDTLKATGGVRYTDYKQDFQQIYGGAVAGAPGAGTSSANPAGFTAGAPNFAATGTVVTNPSLLTPFPMDLAGCPTSPSCPLQYTNLKQAEKPVSPKLGLAWQATPDYLLYGNWSKGFRPGGVNPPVPPLQCAADLAALGLTETPKTFKSDTVSSYELGAKLRLFEGRAQINASAFHIDWKDVQFNLPLRGCAFAFLANAATAKSDGFDVQATTRLGAFTVNANVAYTDARFAETLYTNSTKTTVIANKGDNLGIPDWNVAVGVQYDYQIGSNPAYVRADFQHTGKYMRTTGLGTTSYDALFVGGESTDTANARAGVNIKDVDLALFVQNLTNSDEFVNKSHAVRTPVISGTTFRPRTIGIQARLKF